MVRGFDTIKAMSRAPTNSDEDSEYAFYLDDPIYITKALIVDDLNDPKPRFVVQQQSTSLGYIDGDSISEEQLTTLSSEFLDAMNTDEGVEFLERLHSERQIPTPQDKSGKDMGKIIEALNKAAERQSGSSIFNSTFLNDHVMAKQTRTLQVNGTSTSGLLTPLQNSTVKGDVVLDKQKDGQSRENLKELRVSLTMDDDVLNNDNDTNISRKKQQHPADDLLRSPDLRPMNSKLHDDDDDHLHEEVDEHGDQSGSHDGDHTRHHEENNDDDDAAADHPHIQKLSNQKMQVMKKKETAGGKPKPKRYRPIINHRVEP